MNTTQFLLTDWSSSPLAILCTAAGLAIYFRCCGWSGRAWWMMAAAAIFLLTLMSPLAVLADGYLFCAHMLQHIILLLAVPALILLALPEGTRMPPGIARLLNPVLCWLCGVAAMWVWHAPALCDAAVTSRPIFWVQTLSLLALGTAYWWQLLAPCESQRMPPLHGVLYLFTACTACTVLGIILTFSPVTVCRAYLHPIDRLAITPMIQGTWGITPERDQQVGGLLMWVPMCLVYLSAILGQIARWYAAPIAPIATAALSRTQAAR